MYQRVLGGSNRTFFVAIPFSEWSEIDGWMPVPEILTKAYGETEAAELLQASGEMLDSLSIGISQTVPEFSSGLNPPSGVRPSFAQVIRTEIDPAFSPQSRRVSASRKRLRNDQFLRRLKLVEEEAGVSSTRRVVVQGSQSTYTTARFFDDYAERDSWVGAPGLLENALGEDEGRMLFERQAEAVRTREIYTLRFRPDLSRVP